MLVLDSQDARRMRRLRRERASAPSSRSSSSGSGRRRTGAKRGSPSRWPSPGMPMRRRAGFFVCQQHYPGEFLEPGLPAPPQRRDAASLSVVPGGARAGRNVARSWRAFTGVEPTEPGEAHDLSFALAGGPPRRHDAGRRRRALWVGRSDSDQPSFVALSRARSRTSQRQARLLTARGNSVPCGSAAG